MPPPGRQAAGEEDPVSGDEPVFVRLAVGFGGLYVRANCAVSADDYPLPARGSAAGDAGASSSGAFDREAAGLSARAWSARVSTRRRSARLTSWALKYPTCNDDLADQRREQLLASPAGGSRSEPRYTRNTGQGSERRLAARNPRGADAGRADRRDHRAGGLRGLPDRRGGASVGAAVARPS
eukprot:9665324-Heterocapsa_arctica.AAC.1